VGRGIEQTETEAAIQLWQRVKQRAAHATSGSSGMNVAIIIWGKLMVFNSKRHFQEWLYAQQVTY